MLESQLSAITLGGQLAMPVVVTELAVEADDSTSPLEPRPTEVAGLFAATLAPRTPALPDFKGALRHLLGSHACCALSARSESRVLT